MRRLDQDQARSSVGECLGSPCSDREACPHPRDEEGVEGSDPHPRRKESFLVKLLMTVQMNAEQTKGHRQH